jgi:hypothetical protein
MFAASKARCFQARFLDARTFKQSGSAIGGGGEVPAVGGPSSNKVPPRKTRRR